MSTRANRPTFLGNSLLSPDVNPFTGVLNEEHRQHEELLLQKDDIIRALRDEVVMLRNASSNYYASGNSERSRVARQSIPYSGMPARHAMEMIVELNQLDTKPRLNTSSYVNVVCEPEEEQVAALGASVNLADGNVYPASVHMHDTVVNMIAELWHAPKPKNLEDGSEPCYSGAGTVGSTEACLLAGLAHKFRWRKWYSSKYGLNDTEVKAILPNIIISSCYQAAWEKLFKYMDVEPRFIKPSLANKMRIDPAKIAPLCDEKTIAVVGILGNHYNGAYDPIWEIDEVLSKINQEKGLQIGIHVDGASGGFIAPFQDDLPTWDFGLDNVLSISASGHKFGESVCGTGWVVFRQREDLAEHIAITVTYLGGVADSFTLNFSRPAASVYVQYYKFLRLGWEGYKYKVKNQMKTAQFLRESLSAMKNADGIPRFQIIDCGDKHCLPVLGACLNPDLAIAYDDVDFQHALSESHWYVAGYALSFPNPANHEAIESLLDDCPAKSTMFRVVVKSNLTHYLAEDLCDQIRRILPLMDSMEQGYQSISKARARCVSQPRPLAPAMRQLMKEFKDHEGGMHHLNHFSAC